MVPPTAIAAGFTYMAYKAFCPEAHPKASSVVNPTILKKNEKVVDTVDVEDISEKAVFCRCWRSKNVSKHQPTRKIYYSPCCFILHLFIIFCFIFDIINMSLEFQGTK